MPAAVPATRDGLGTARPDSGAGRPALISVLAFAALAAVIRQAEGGWLGRVDQRVTALAAARRSTNVVRAARAISGLAEPAVVLTAVAASAAAAARRDGWRAAVTPCLTVASGTRFRWILSQAVARPRPPAAYWLTEPEGFSLPSRHTCTAALTAGSCAAALRAGPGAAQAAALLAAAGVGTSRVCLGVHWPTDVVTAWLFTVGWLNLARLAAARPAPRGNN